MPTTQPSFPFTCAFTTIRSPVGTLVLIASEHGLHALLWEKHLRSPSARKLFKGMRENPRHPILLRTKRQLEEYFAGRRRRFDLPVVVTGTPFQKRAWQQLARIPYGETTSYQEQAEALGDASKARAVAAANAKNPLCIILPCHRVLAKSGALSGFSGGVAAKKFLLDLERSAPKA